MSTPRTRRCEKPQNHPATPPTSNHTRPLTTRVLGLTAACSIILAVAACSGDDTTNNTTPTTTSDPTNENTTTTTTTPTEESRSGSEASTLIDWIAQQPTTYSMRGEATINIPPPPETTSIPPPPVGGTTRTPQNPSTPNTGTLTKQAVFETDTEGNLSILAHTPPNLHHYLPEGGSYQIIYKDDTMFLRPPLTEHTETQQQEAWLAFTTTNQHRTLLEGLSCIFFIPEPPQQQNPETTPTPARCNLQDGLHAILDNTHNPRTTGTETLHDPPTTKISFNTTPTPTTPTLNGTIWIDESNLIRRLEISHTPTPGPPGPPEENEHPNPLLTLRFHSFGADISIQTPPLEHVQGEHIINLTTTTQQQQNQ